MGLGRSSVLNRRFHQVGARTLDPGSAPGVQTNPLLPSCVQVVEVLASVGFTPQLQNTPVGSLSGGWKMKLALGEAG